MRLSDVPSTCRAIECETCHDHLAIPRDGTPADQQAAADQAMADHLVMCPGPPAEPTPAADIPLDHGTIRDQLRAVIDDPTWCPGSHGHHCGHWKAGGECCACYECRPESL